MNPSFFVTGTDTGVGKTWVTAALVAALRKAGRDVVPMKPVQTGCDPRGIAMDIELVLGASGLTPDRDELPAISPYRFALAASPHLAAQDAGTPIVLENIVAAFHSLRRKHEGVIVEGAGGVLAPLDESRAMIDVMKALALPVIVVARPGLGTLNHTLLTAGEIARAGLLLHAVVLNEAHGSGWGRIEDDNLTTLRRRLAPAQVLRFPHTDLASLARAGQQHLGAIFQ